MNASVLQVLNFLIAKQNASEESPLRLGNVEFWHPVPGFGAGLCYSIPVSQWDVSAVQADLNRIASPVWEELVEHLKTSPAALGAA